MKYKNEENFIKEINENFKIDCQRCFGFCCVALYFSASDGFPVDKVAGKPCSNLQSDFTCSIHNSLRKKGLKGCTSYDCFGAGQKVAQSTYGGMDWKRASESSEEMFQVFLIMRQIHEMLWYLAEAFIINKNGSIKEKISSLINELEGITSCKADFLIKLDIESYRDKVNFLLKQTSEFVRMKALNKGKETIKRRKTIAGRLDLIGVDLRKINLKGADLRGAFLIAADLRENDLSGADLIGADLRDADLRGTNLRNSIFVTQAQINVAKGDSNTKLPIFLSRPTYWEK